MKAHLRATSVSSLLPRKTFCISQPPAFQALMIKLTRSRQMMRTDPAFFSSCSMVPRPPRWSTLRQYTASGTRRGKWRSTEGVRFPAAGFDSDRVGPNDAPAPYSHGEELATQPHLERYDDEALNDRLTTVQDGDL